MLGKQLETLSQNDDEAIFIRKTLLSSHEYPHSEEETHQDYYTHIPRQKIVETRSGREKLPSRVVR